MKKIIYKSLWLILLSFVIASCKPKLTQPAADKGNADFTTYVSLGDGVPAGYADGALSLDCQLAAFPTILAQQFKLVGGAGEFVQPLIEAGKSYGFEANKASTKLALKTVTFCDGKTQLYPLETGSITLIDILNFKITNPGLKYNNLAAQGTRVTYVDKATWKGTSGTYWNKFRSSGSTTQLKDALAQNPTFFTLYLGGTDVFRFAKSGGNQESAAGPTNDDGITSIKDFTDSYTNIVKALTANGAKGAVINLIDLESFPYFKYYKYDDLVLTASQAKDLNDWYATKYPYSVYKFVEGRNAYVIEDPAALSGHRRIKKGEYICLQLHPDSTNINCSSSPKWGSYKPLPQRWVLDENEIQQVNDAVAGYNAAIKQIASDFGLAFVDSYSDMKKNLTGSNYNGITMSTDYVSGGEFSLDGLNISPRGQVILANMIIDAINKTYKSKIPYANANKALGVNFE